MAGVTVDDAIAIVKAKLGSRAARHDITPASRLDDLGLSSLEVADTFFDLEEKVGQQLDPTAAADAQTLQELVEVVNHQVALAAGEQA
jgi:acyl carrier protein